MISLFDLWEEFIGTVNTHQGGHVKPNRNFVMWVNSISKDLFKEKCEDYQKSQILSDDITIFLKTVNINVPLVPNQMWDLIKTPPDYEFFADARVYRRGAGDNAKACGCIVYDTIDGKTGDKGQCTDYIDEDELAAMQAQQDANLCEVGINKVPTNRWQAICEHRNLKPTVNNPKCTQFDKGFKIAPKGIGVIILDYFRAPAKATFDYTILNPGLENEYIQFAATSLPLEWKSTMVPEFIAQLQKKYGRFVREPQIEQAGIHDEK